MSMHHGKTVKEKNKKNTSVQTPKHHKTMHACMYACMCAHVDIHYIHTHICIYICICMGTHTHMLMSFLLRLSGFCMPGRSRQLCVARASSTTVGWLEQGTRIYKGFYAYGALQKGSFRVS